MSEEFDDLASAYVDGEATAEEIARVESDPELLALVEEFRLLTTSTSALPKPDSAQRESHIAAALAAFDAETAGRETAAASPTVTSLTERRAKKGVPGWMLNAAAVLVVVGGVGFAITQLPDSGDETATEAVDAEAMADEAGDISSAAPNAAAGSAESTAALQAGGVDEDAADAAMADADDAGVAMEEEAMEDEEAMEEDTASDESTDEAGESPTTTTVRTARYPVDFAGTETASEVLEVINAGDGYQALLVSDSMDCAEQVVTEGFEPAGPALGFVVISYGQLDALLLLFGDETAPTPVLVDSDCVLLSTE